MPIQLASAMTVREAEEQERQPNHATYLADFVASQPRLRDIPQSSKEGSDNQHGESTATGGAGDDYDNSQERSKLPKQWKGARFSRDEVEELLKQEPACNRCSMLKLPCYVVKPNLTCRECQTAEVVCPREKQGDGEVAKVKEKAKKSGVNRSRKAKGKGKDIESVLKIVIPGGRGSKSNETPSKRSNSWALGGDDGMEDEEDELEMYVDVPETSKFRSQLSHPRIPQVIVDTPATSIPQFRCSDLQVLGANNNQKADEGSKIAMVIPDHSTPHQYSDLPVLHTNNTQLAAEKDDLLELRVDTPALQLAPASSRFRSQIPDTSLELKCKMDDLSRVDLNELLKACEDHRILSRQLLDDVTSTKDDLANHVLTFGDLLMDCRMRIKVYEGGDDMLANLKREWTEARSEVQQAVKQRLEAESQLTEVRREMEILKGERDHALHQADQLNEILQELRATQSEVRQVENQGHGANLKPSELRGKVEVLTEELDLSLKEAHQLRDLPPEFGWGAPSGRVAWPSDKPSTEGEKSREITSLINALATRGRMFDMEKNLREKLESEVIVLRSELGKANLYSHLLSEYEAFAREVWTTAYALQGVEASIRHKTQFPCEDFRTMIRSLFDASIKAKERVGVMERGKFKIVGFIELDDSDSNQWRSPFPDQEKRGRKRKERDDEHDESRVGSRHRHD